MAVLLVTMGLDRVAVHLDVMMVPGRGVVARDSITYRLMTGCRARARRFPLEGAMRIVGALCLALLMLTGAGTAAHSANGIRLENGKLVIAQSYCAMCATDRTTCVTKCNGSGACIQNCDNDYQLCVERACRGRR
ncbi:MULTISPECIES: hypothetical protein [Bradyrhizobium]|uniref:hypothetical protein n=1 Tax=Bradyrhizobium TaxID=374 RepID=UPI000465E847|nr:MULTISPECIES: hypothetical protein [Bradyrhizobium]AUC99048.1 hypothetical protein CWS35_35985 [Bradyrhizobium sp. SK17]